MYYGSTLLGDYVQSASSSEKEIEGDKTRYFYQLSAIAAYGNSTISNCYVYGGRTNIYVNTGNVTITDTITENGTVANIQIESNKDYIVTLNNTNVNMYF